MHHHSKTTRSALALGAFLLCMLPVTAQAARSKGTIDGSLTSVSLSTKTLTVKARGGAQTILKLDASSRIVRNGKRVGLAELALRDRISAQFDLSTLRLQKAQARGPEVGTFRGRFASWDRSTRLLLAVGPRGERAFLVNGSTLVVRNGQASRPLDLRAGDSLTIHTRGGRPPLAADVGAEGESEDNEDDEAEVEGDITAIAGNDVTIAPENGGATVTVHVVDSTRIRLEDKTEGTIADLAVGDEVEAEYSPDTFNAIKIKLEDEDDEEEDEAEVEGTLAALDAAAGTFSITPEHGGAVVGLSVDDSTEITLDGEPATLADLSVGDEAKAKFDADTGVASRLRVRTDDDEGDDEGGDDDDDDDDDDDGDGGEGHG